MRFGFVKMGLKNLGQATARFSHKCCSQEHVEQGTRSTCTELNLFTHCQVQMQI